MNVVPAARDEPARALQSLVGRPLAAARRDGNVVAFRFGEADDAPTLHLACSWRLASDAELLAASGDVFTPADPDEDLEGFDWERPGASWADVRLAAWVQRHAGRPAVVRQVESDVLGGLRVALDDGTVLEAFPDSSPAPHVETEFWRLVPADGPHLVVGTAGAEMVRES